MNFMQLPTLPSRPLETLVSGYSATSIFRTIGFIGDSLLSGEIELLEPDGSRSYHDFYEHSWGNYIARKNGQRACVFARGGMTAREYMQSFADEIGAWEKAKACQAYVIALGANDLGANHQQAVGTVCDIAPDDWRKNGESFLGYYAQIVARLKQDVQPDAKFFFVSMPRRNSDYDTLVAQPHREAMYALAAHFENCYVIDLYQYGPVYDAAFHEQYFLNGHLTTAGYLLTAQLIDSYIDWIVRANPNDFRYASLIGTGIAIPKE